jgi:hypothetical protein
MSTFDRVVTGVPEERVFDVVMVPDREIDQVVPDEELWPECVYDRSRAVEGRAHGLRIAYLCMCVAHDQSRSQRRKLSPFGRVLVLQVYEAAVFNRVICRMWKTLPSISTTHAP